MELLGREERAISSTNSHLHLFSKEVSEEILKVKGQVEFQLPVIAKVQ